MRKSLLLIAALFLWPLPGLASTLTIEISEGVTGAHPVAVVPFERVDDIELDGSGPDEVLATNLTRSGRFSLLESDDMPEHPHSGSEIDFDRWRDVGMDHVVVGRLADAGNGVRVRFQVYDPYQEEQVIGYSFRVPRNQLRRLGHRIADLVYEAILGRPGAFSTSLAYVRTEDEDGDEPRHVLAVADADGHSEQIILDSSEPLMSPAWDPDGKRLAYVSFERGRPQIFLQTIATGWRERLSEDRESSSAPAFSPDGERLAYVSTRDGERDIYIMDLERDGEPIRVTSHYAIDTEPAWLPDGRGLIFTSDRSGRPQLYRIELDPRGRPEGSPRRITFEGGYNASPSVSQDGRHVAMVQGDRGAFRIAVLDMERGATETIADVRRGESPSYAPNGDMLIYATEENGRGVLESVSSEGRARQRLGLDVGNVREPAWSPFDALSQ